MTAPWLPKPDAVSALLAAAEALRAAVRPLETVELADAEARQDLRDLIAGVRRAAFVAVSLGARELGRTCGGSKPAVACQQSSIQTGTSR